MTVNLETDVWSFANGYVQPSRGPVSTYPRSLEQAVEAAVDMVQARFLMPQAKKGASLASQSRTLLALLTFCYARQVYSSSAIAAQLRRDLNWPRTNRDEVPDANVLQHFRCENRRPLGLCLRMVLRFLAEEKIRQGFVTHVKEVHLAEEAGRRIIMAMFTDSLEQGKATKPEAQVEPRFGGCQ